MIITALMENFCEKGGFRGEHGLSLRIQARSADIVFDTGSTGAFMENSRALGFEPGPDNVGVLSHGHYDHSGGLAALFKGPRRPAVLYAGHGYDRKRFAVAGKERRSIGLPFSPRSDGLPDPFIVSFPEQLDEGIFILPAAEMKDGSKPLERFRTEAEGGEALDYFSDELSLAVIEEDGLSVVTGCAHRGIVNIVASARGLFPGIRLKAVIGGFHLSIAEDGEIVRVASALAGFDPGRIFCMHCTGVRGYAGIAAALPGRTAWLSCGSSVTI